MIILGAILASGVMYGVYEMVKGQTKEVWQMIDEQYHEEKKTMAEVKEIKEKYFNWI